MISLVQKRVSKHGFHHCRKPSTRRIVLHFTSFIIVLCFLNFGLLFHFVEKHHDLDAIKLLNSLEESKISLLRKSNNKAVKWAQNSSSTNNNHEIEYEEHHYQQQGDNDNDGNPSLDAELTNGEWNQIKKEKFQILKLLVDIYQLQNKRYPALSAAIDQLRNTLDGKTLRALPTWANITYLYGSKPIIKGIHDSEGVCEQFQSKSPSMDHLVAVAGTFNSGTHLMSSYLMKNCHIQERMDAYGKNSRGVRWQVPWGKHNPAGDDEFRRNHAVYKGNATVSDPNTNVLAAVTIRNPYNWMKSMCRIHYAAYWVHEEDTGNSSSRHCPNIIANDVDLEISGNNLRKGQTLSVRVHYDKNFVKKHLSLVEFWNDWYHEYWRIPEKTENSLSRLIVRYEDLLFRPRETTELVCKCAGGDLRRDEKFSYELESAKVGTGAHGPMELRTDFIQALIKYGNVRQKNPPLKTMTPDDLSYAAKNLDTQMMSYFHYKHPREIIM